MRACVRAEKLKQPRTSRARGQCWVLGVAPPAPLHAAPHHYSPPRFAVCVSQRTEAAVSKPLKKTHTPSATCQRRFTKKKTPTNRFAAAAVSPLSVVLLSLPRPGLGRWRCTPCAPNHPPDPVRNGLRTRLLRRGSKVAFCLWCRIGAVGQMAGSSSSSSPLTRSIIPKHASWRC